MNKRKLKVIVSSIFNDGMRFESGKTLKNKDAKRMRREGVAKLEALFLSQREELLKEVADFLTQDEDRRLSKTGQELLAKIEKLRGKE